MTLFFSFFGFAFTDLLTSHLEAFFHSRNYRVAQEEAVRKNRYGKTIYLELSGDSWKGRPFSEKSLGGYYATVGDMNY
jgi:hypothetical protein